MVKFFSFFSFLFSSAIYCGCKLRIGVGLVNSTAFTFWLNNWQTTGEVWECDLCNPLYITPTISPIGPTPVILADSCMCVAAEVDYWSAHPDINTARIDAIYNYEVIFSSVTLCSVSSFTNIYLVFAEIW
jgi:hypothetical protein